MNTVWARTASKRGKKSKSTARIKIRADAEVQSDQKIRDGAEDNLAKLVVLLKETRNEIQEVREKEKELLEFEEEINSRIWEARAVLESALYDVNHSRNIASEANKKYKQSQYPFRAPLDTGAGGHALNVLLNKRSGNLTEAELRSTGQTSLAAKKNSYKVRFNRTGDLMKTIENPRGHDVVLRFNDGTPDVQGTVLRHTKKKITVFGVDVGRRKFMLDNIKEIILVDNQNKVNWW